MDRHAVRAGTGVAVSSITLPAIGDIRLPGPAPTRSLRRCRKATLMQPECVRVAFLQNGRLAVEGLA